MKKHDVEDEPRDAESHDAAEAASGASAPELESALRERDEFRANWQRAQADYQNLRRRLASDTEASVARSKRPLLLDLLLVLDYLDMALATRAATQEGKDVLAGVELTRSALLRALERESVRAMPATGAFDSAQHEAVESVATDEVPAGHIVQTLRRGYTVNDQVLRPAQVRVAKSIADEDEAS